MMINKDNDYNKDENRDDDNGNQVFPPGSKHGVADNKVHRRGRCNTIVYGTIKTMRSYNERFNIHVSVHVRFW